jgi:glucosamine--fructose-6-phosphate aminotransferase (isomerizing)
VLGVGKDENFLASDVSAIVAHTRDAVYLNDFDIVAVSRDKFEISSVAGESGNYQISKVEFGAEDVSKGDFPHYMLKEIFEQPNSVRDAMRRAAQHRRMHRQAWRTKHDRRVNCAMSHASC